MEGVTIARVVIKRHHEPSNGVNGQCKIIHLFYGESGGGGRKTLPLDGRASQNDLVVG